VGAETKDSILDIKSNRHFFTNEGGALKRNFFARNITGFWIIQKCVERWEKQEGRKISWKEIDEVYIKEKPFASLINTEDPVFLNNNDDMPKAIAEYCRKNNIRISLSKSGISRCIYESLIMSVRFYFELLKKYCNKDFKKVHVIGGGVNNSHFCQWLSNALGIEIIAGPVEASTVGNLLMQLKADREIDSIEEGRKICLDSVLVKSHSPEDTQIWDEKYKEYLSFFNLNTNII